ncbi:hypothetical protein ZHAS_00004137 [Anopheles sinensis]|uniref:Uncharacterized protein n=1 Tax=Anopheles sinensis TaxID=74873 RepID=A0A084VG73_ANOSI|nr:hypothetical protein ZHAS_00004137 [Anopheles sinensis]
MQVVNNIVYGRSSKLAKSVYEDSGGVFVAFGEHLSFMIFARGGDFLHRRPPGVPGDTFRYFLLPRKQPTTPSGEKRHKEKGPHLVAPRQRNEHFRWRATRGRFP